MFIYSVDWFTLSSYIISQIDRNSYCTLKMANVWYIDNNQENEGRQDTKEISSDELFEKTGVQLIKLNVNTYDTDGILDKLKKSRGYNYEDELECSKDTPNINELLKGFFTEHVHADEEIRLFLDGNGYFDVRDDKDRWIRIAVSGGDLIILPAGIYHRFMLASDNYIKMRRFFTEEPVWRAYNRPADELDCRKEYIKKLTEGFHVIPK